MAGKQMTSGPTSDSVRKNIAHFRGDLGMSYAELSRELERRGHGIPPLGLRRIEAGERRVDVDDLMALALALNVNPHALLLPRERGESVECEVTGHPGGALQTQLVWQWASGLRSLTHPGDRTWLQGRFGERVRPVEVLTDDERYERRRQWVQSRWGELKELADAEIAEGLAEGYSEIIPGQHWEMEKLVKVDVRDDAQWAVAAFDPAPPTRSNRA